MNKWCFPLIFAGFFIFASTAQAENFLTDAGKKISYDIYLQGTDDRLIVIKDVEIVRQEKINDTAFLVIRPAQFSLTPAEGYILLSYVKVILPNREIKISSFSASEINFR